MKQLFPDLRLRRLSFEYPGSAGAGPRHPTMAREQRRARPRHSHGDPTSLAPHERLTDLTVVPREKAHTGPPLENNPETPPSSRDEGLRLLHGLETNLATSLQTPQEAWLPLVHPVSSKRYPWRLESRAGFSASTRDECLSPRVRLECNPEIPVAPGEEHWLLDTSLDSLTKDAARVACIGNVESSSLDH